MILVDSHCHIDGEKFEADRDEVVQRAKDAGVAVMLNIGTGDPSTDDFRRAVAVAEKYDNVYASVGVHPHDAKLYDDKAEAHLTELVRSSKKVIAWGEIGLDFHYDHSPRDVQIDVFRRQIRTARELDLPIIAEILQLNRMLIETDCPFLTPEPFRGRRNEPAFVVHTARFLADLCEIELSAFADQTTQNFLNFFKLKLAAD
jgi:TatD DNase family protein